MCVNLVIATGFSCQQLGCRFHTVGVKAWGANTYAYASHHATFYSQHEREGGGQNRCMQYWSKLPTSPSSIVTLFSLHRPTTLVTATNKLNDEDMAVEAYKQENTRLEEHVHAVSAQLDGMRSERDALQRANAKLTASEKFPFG